MLVFNIEFWIIFFLALPIYYYATKNVQNYFLLFANFLFLYFTSASSAALCLLSILVQYFVYTQIVSLGIDQKKIRFQWLLLGIFLQLSVLITYKISSHFEKSFPIGISYYSLMLIACITEGYWNRHSKKLNLIEFTTSASFFPIVVMGPIEKMNWLGQQLANRRNHLWENFRNGFYSLALGVFKITAVSNVLSSVVNHEKIFSESVQGFGLIFYCFLSYIAIYGNFSGYIDIISGISSFLGFKISPNFNQPYLAKNIIDVWRRWHISLTVWLRDFIYLPILLKTKNIYLSYVAVIVCVGLWHGISPEYFYWVSYWILLFLIYSGYKKISTSIKILEFFKISFVANSLTLFAVSLSTLCFMIPFHGLNNLTTRLVSFSFDNLKFFFTQSDITTLEWMTLILSLAMVALYETPAFRKIEKFNTLKILILVFLIASFGQIKSGHFLYLRL